MTRLNLQHASSYMAVLSALAAIAPGAHAQGAANSEATPAATSASAAKPAAPVRGSSLAHVVKQGETLGSLCSQFRIAAAQCPQVAYFNKLDNNQLPATGSIVYVPLHLLPSRPQQARLVQTAGQVQVNGQTVRAGVRLDENTRIAAQAGSSAVVELADGSRVTVLPSSVADIVHSRNYTAPDATSSGKIMQWIGSKIRLVQGAIESAVKKRDTPTDANKPVEVETVTSLIGVRGTQFRVAAADKYVPFDRAEVLEGSVSNINTWQHSEITLQAGQGAVVDPNHARMQATTLLPAPAMTAAPEQQQTLRRPQAIWSFKPVAGAAAYRVMASGDARFESIRFSEKTSTPSADLSQLPDGVWHMRARAIDAQGLEGYDAHATIDLRPPAWVLRNASVHKQQGNLLLQWSAIATTDFKPLPGNTRVTLEIARSPDFAAPLAQLQTRGNDIRLPGLGPGHYYLRMAVDNDSIKNKEQQTFMLHIPADTYHMGYNLLLQEMPQP